MGIDAPLSVLAHISITGAAAIIPCVQSVEEDAESGVGNGVVEAFRSKSTKSVILCAITTGLLPDASIVHTA